MNSRLQCRQAKWVISFFVIACIISYIYVLINGDYNGDFIKKDVAISNLSLTLIFILTVLPFIYLYYIFRHFSKINYCQNIYNLNIMRYIAWTLLLLQIMLRFSGYGTMGSESTGISGSPISILRALAYKLPAYPFAVIYIMGSKYNRGIAITIGLLCLYSIINKSLGGFFTTSMILIYKYPSITLFLKKHFIITGIILLLCPPIVGIAYDFRSQLRDGPEIAEKSGSDLLFGKVCGRISSFSNNAYIFQNLPSLYVYKKEVPDEFYIMDMLHFFGIRPEFKSTGNFVEMQVKHGKDERYSSMAGIGGVLFISLIKSPWIAILNLSVILGSVYLLFLIATKIKLRNACGVALLLSVWFMANGDSSEIAINIYSLLFAWFILKLIAHKHVVKH